MNFYQCILTNGVNESPWWVKMKINFHVVHLYSASMDDTILKILSVSVILFVILDNTTIALSREFFLLCFWENQGQKLEKSVSQVKKVSKGSGVNSDTTFCLSAKLTMVLFFELENPARPHCRINPIVSSPFNSKQKLGLLVDFTAVLHSHKFLAFFVNSYNLSYGDTVVSHIHLMIFSLTLPFRMCMSLLEKKITMESAYTLLQPYLSSGTGTQGMMDF